jgi:hypothetical protein
MTQAWRKRINRLDPGIGQPFGHLLVRHHRLYRRGQHRERRPNRSLGRDDADLGRPRGAAREWQARRARREPWPDGSRPSLRSGAPGLFALSTDLPPAWFNIWPVRVLHCVFLGDMAQAHVE